MELLKSFFKEEEGIGTIEIVLIAVVLIGLVLLFKKQITIFLESIMDKLEGESSEIFQKKE